MKIIGEEDYNILINKLISLNVISVDGNYLWKYQQPYLKNIGGYFMDDLDYCTINIYNSLKSKYSDYLKPEIVSITLIQVENDVLLESVELEYLEEGLEKQTVRRINLDFISDGDEPDGLFFNPKEPIEKNARRFINEFSPYSIINTTDLFHDDACEKINNRYNRFGIDK